MRISKRSAAFLVGLAVPFAALLVAAVASSRPGPPESAGGGGPRYGPAYDLQSLGPLGYGDRVSFEEARDRVAFSLPYLAENTLTGDETGMWLALRPGAEGGPLLAPLWKSDLRFYVEPSEMTPAEAAAEWEREILTEPEAGRQNVLVRGLPGIGTDGSGEAAPSSLAWI